MKVLWLLVTLAVASCTAPAYAEREEKKVCADWSTEPHVFYHQDLTHIGE